MEYIYVITQICKATHFRDKSNNEDKEENKQIQIYQSGTVYTTSPFMFIEEHLESLGSDAYSAAQSDHGQLPGRDPAAHGAQAGLALLGDVFGRHEGLGAISRHHRSPVATGIRLRPGGRAHAPRLSARRQRDAGPGSWGRSFRTGEGWGVCSPSTIYAWLRGNSCCNPAPWLIPGSTRSGLLYRIPVTAQDPGGVLDL